MTVEVGLIQTDINDYVVNFSLPVTVKDALGSVYDTSTATFQGSLETPNIAGLAAANLAQDAQVFKAACETRAAAEATLSGVRAAVVALLLEP